MSAILSKSRVLFSLKWQSIHKVIIVHKIDDRKDNKEYNYSTQAQNAKYHTRERERQLANLPIYLESSFQLFNHVAEDNPTNHIWTMSDKIFVYTTNQKWAVALLELLDADINASDDTFGKILKWPCDAYSDMMYAYQPHRDMPLLAL